MDRANIDKVFLDRVTMEQAVQRVSTMLEEPRDRAAHIVTMNAQFVEIAHGEERFADLIARADLNVADGLSLVWASRVLGQVLPERVAGVDLMIRLCETAAASGKSVYFLGGSPGAASRTAELLLESLPALRIVGIDCPPHGFLEDPVECNSVADRIGAARPDLLFVGLGAPKQEYWIERYAHLPAKVMMGIGGSFEFASGFRKRAPLFWQKVGVEWLWRLCLEPRRLWRRYLIGNTVFIFLVLRQWCHQALNKTAPEGVPSEVIQPEN
jgi:N-acetylglucosaminyldiphosphoundecaprenol N-acetyl-beta-D-mannosaminyltransferase